MIKQRQTTITSKQPEKERESKEIATEWKIKWIFLQFEEILHCSCTISSTKHSHSSQPEQQNAETEIMGITALKCKEWDSGLDTKSEKKRLTFSKMKWKKMNRSGEMREKSKHQATNHCFLCMWAFFYNLWFFWNVSGIFVREIIWMYMQEHAPSKETRSFSMRVNSENCLAQTSGQQREIEEEKG